MNLEQARIIAEQYVTAAGKRTGIEVVILDEYTIERPFGWVFFYDSKKHVESGSIRDAIAGNAPIIVSRSDGSMHVTGTAYPIEHYIREFERQQ